MISLFRDKSIITFIVLGLLCILTHAHIFVHPVLIDNHIDNGLISLFISQYMLNWPPMLLSFLFIFIIFIQSIWLNTLLDEWKMFQKSALTTSAAFILLSACFPEQGSISPALINNFIVILFITVYARMYNNQKPNTLLFNIGFIISTATILYKPNVIFLLISFIALAIIRPFKLKEWLILLIGICVPIYLLFSGLFIVDKTDFIKTTIPYFQLHAIVIKISVWYWIKVSVVLLSLLIGINQWLPNYDRMVIHIRRNWIILFLSMLILAGIPFILYQGNIIDFWILLPMMACFISALLLYPKRMLLPNMVLILFLILIAHSNLVLMGIVKK